MNETSKIRNIAIKYCTGCGIDVACGDEKISDTSIGIDSSIGEHEFRDLSCVNIKEKILDLSLFASNSLGYVYTSHFLEHLQDPVSMLIDMIRAVKPGGHVVIYLPDRLLYTEPNPDHHNMWTLDEFKKIVPDSVEIVEEIGAHHYSFFIAMRKK